ncbi:unnamed protein product, partial [Citrullus colocynthis]
YFIITKIPCCPFHLPDFLVVVLHFSQLQSCSCHKRSERLNVSWGHHNEIRASTSDVWGCRKATKRLEHQIGWVL